MLNRLMTLREERAAKDDGFTLIELLVVVVIIGILLAIAIPLYLNFTNGAHDKSAQADVHNAVAVVNQCESDNNGTLPAAAASSAAGASFNLTCGTATETVNVSPGNTVSYAPTTGGNYTITGTDASGTTYTYDSSTGQLG